MLDLRKYFFRLFVNSKGFLSYGRCFKNKLFLFNVGCGLKYFNDYNGDLNYLVKRYYFLFLRFF